MPKLSLSKAQIAYIKEQAIPGRPYRDRVSVVLALRLIHLGSTRDLDTYAVLNEIDFLDGCRACSRTKKASQFRHPPLYPLWHKHFTTARHVQKNICVRWSLNRGGKRDLDRLIHEVAAAAGHDPELWPALLADRMVLEGYEARAGTYSGCSLTGDWIIYGNHGGKNYYLDLASHEEGHDGDSLYRKLRSGCHAEFPFLFSEEVGQSASAPGGMSPKNDT